MIQLTCVICKSAQPLNFPTIEITLDRLKISQLGLDIKDISNSVTASTSSSRFTEKNLWLDAKNQYTYQVQIQVPEYVMNSMDQLKEIPLIQGKSSPVLGDVATFKTIYSPGEYDRVGPRRYLSVSANIYKTDLGKATSDVQRAVNSIGAPPKGLIATLGGMSGLLTETLSSLQNGLMFAVLVIFLLLAANYLSFKVGINRIVYNTGSNFRSLASFTTVRVPRLTCNPTWV